MLRLASRARLTCLESYQPPPSACGFLSPKALGKARQADGFTLVEVMMATLLLTVALVGGAAMLTTTVNGKSVSSNRAIATALAQDQLEAIRRADYATVLEANYPQEDYATMAGYEQFQRTVTVANDTPVMGSKIVTVTVTWRDPFGAVRNSMLSTVLRP